MSKQESKLKFGLTSQDIEVIQSVLFKHQGVQMAILYGSRAKGSYRRGSDIDLALKGSLSLSELASIHSELNEETPLPYFFDVLHYDTLSAPSLKAHIDRVGKTIFKRPQR